MGWINNETMLFIQPIQLFYDVLGSYFFSLLYFSILILSTPALATFSTPL